MVTGKQYVNNKECVMQLTNFKMYEKEGGNPNSLYMMSDEGMD